MTDPPERFLLDAMLGRLATYLRMCGYDAAYALDRGVEADDRLREIARREDRRLVTRDVSLAEEISRAASESTEARERERESEPRDPILLTEREVTAQLREIRAAGYELTLDGPPSRCGNCNGQLRRLDEGESRPAYVPDDRERVWRCRACEQCFWTGSHWDRVAERLREVRANGDGHSK